MPINPCESCQTLFTTELYFPTLELKNFQVEYLRLYGDTATELLARARRDLNLRIQPHLLTVSSWSMPRFGDFYEDFCDPPAPLFIVR